MRGGGQSIRPVEVFLASLKSEGVKGFSVVVTDLTERKNAEQALRDSNAKLREMVRELEHFSYSISHDMRAPLRAMKSFAVLIEDQCAHGERLVNRDLLRRISAAATRLDALVQGALHYARVVQHDLVKEPVDLGKLVSGLSDTYPNLLQEKANIHVEPGLPVILGNESALTQVFSNLLGNAVKFVPPGTRPCVRVWADPASSAGFVRIWVQDNGIGVPKEAHATIFDMFQRASKDYEGTGIGLAVVRKAVERMGGRVGLESEEGKGSRFWLELKAVEH